MRLKTTFILLFLGCIPASGAWCAEPARRSTQDAIRIATQRAADELFLEVEKIPLADRMTLGQYVKTIGAEEELKRSLERAEQIGAPRWVDANTCQIQLEISMTRVSTAMRQMVSSRSDSPLRWEEINQALSRYPRKSVFSLGATSFASSVGEYRPTSTSWSTVPENARRAALLEAFANARQNVFENLAGVKLAGQATLGEALKADGVQAFLTDYFAQRPVTRVDFKDNLTVEVALGVDVHGLFDVLRTVLERQGGAGIPRTDDEWAKVEAEFVKKVGPAIGKASASKDKPASAWNAPKKAPDWVDQFLDIRGTGKGANKLKSAIIAEQDARLKLRLRLDTLEVEPGKPLAQLAQSQSYIGLKLARVVEDARIIRTEYLPDGSATVQLQLNLGNLWDELRK